MQRTGNGAESEDHAPTPAQPVPSEEQLLLKRKRRKDDTFNDSLLVSKKQEQPKSTILSTEPVEADDAPVFSPSGVVSGKYDLNLSPEKSLFGMNNVSPILSKKQRNRMKLLRKREEQKRKEDKAEWKQQETSTLAQGNGESEVAGDNTNLDSYAGATNGIPSTYQPNDLTAALSQEIPLEQSSGKPSRKKRKERTLEIAATQEPRSPARQQNQSSPEGTPLPEPKHRSLLSLKSNSTKKSKRSTTPLHVTRLLDFIEQDPDDEASGEQDMPTQLDADQVPKSRTRQTSKTSVNKGIDSVSEPPSQKSPSTPHKKRKRQVSAQRIYDSSAEEEEPSAVGSSKRRKVGDLVKLQKEDHHQSKKTSSTEVKLNDEEKDIRQFTSEEDDRLKQVISQYKQRENISDEDFLQQLSGKVRKPEFMVDIELEEWPEDRDSKSLFRRIQHLYNFTPQTRKPGRLSSTTYLYSEQEDEIIKAAVKGYLKLEKITEDDFAALLEQDSSIHYTNRKTRPFLIELAPQLPGRGILSVTRHLMKLYPAERYDNERWTKEDDVKLAKLVAQKGMSWTKIAAEMGQSAEIVRLRYKDYVSLGETRVRGRWKQGELDRLREAIGEKLVEAGREEGVDRKGREEVSGFIDWNAVSERVETRSRLQCRARYVKSGFSVDV